MRFCRAIIATAFLAVCSSASALETAYWAWHRSEPLSEIECVELSAQSVRILYWQMGELENLGETWRWKAKFALPRDGRCDLRLVPVVRLESRERSPFSEPSLQSLRNALVEATKGADGLQIDYDAPDRLIEEYGTALRRIHASIPKLSITALPGWSRSSVLRVLEGSVDELIPMFYDFEPDPVVEGSAPLPLLASDKVERFLNEWNKCQISWRAGFPSFARVTLFDPSGRSRGHIREWNWDDLCFNKSLATFRPTALGVTVLKARTATRVTNTPVKTDQLLAVRWPDRTVLAQGIDRVRQTSARGIVFFRLPDSSAPSGWSIRQLGKLTGTPQLKFRKIGMSPQLQLLNESDTDLEPRLSGANGQAELDRGYSLEVDAPAAIFRDAHEGDFWRVIGHVDPDGARRVVAIPLATRLTFWFSHLRARQSLLTGVIQLAPGITFDQIRYRIRNMTGDSEWKKIEE